MTDLMVSSKRPRAPSFANKHPDYSEAHATATSDWSVEKEMMRQIPVKTFLEICRFCKKNLRQDEDVFMYGYFGAFCTKNCRAKQIACDIFTESSREIAKAKKGRTGELIRAKESKAVGNRESIASPRFYI